MAKISGELDVEAMEQEEKRKYFELNNMSEAQCTVLDIERIKFNVEYRLEQEVWFGSTATL